MNASEALTIARNGVSLEAVLHVPEAQGPVPGVVVCHPHPLYGGDMHNNVVMAIVAGVLDAGAAALRFNFRGVPGSTGTHDKGNGERDDAVAALRAMREDKRVDGSRVGIAGYSFGANVAMAVAAGDSAVPALALVGAPAAGLATPEATGYPHPKLIVAGDRDNALPADQIDALTRAMKGPVEVQVLPGADHFLLGYEGAISKQVQAFFAATLAG